MSRIQPAYVDSNSGPLKNFSTPSSPEDLVNKSYFDAHGGILAQQSVVQATNSSNQTIQHAFADISFDTDATNFGPDITHDITGIAHPNSQFRVNATGHYICAYSFSTGLQTASGTQARVFLNNTIALNQSRIDDSQFPNDNVFSASFAVFLNAGDFITLQIQDPATPNISALANKTSFMIYRLGAIQGVQGTTGAQGFVGPQGVYGMQGAVGAGVQGAMGIQGFVGPQGIQGVGFQGNDGFQGVKGCQGFQGNTGATGAAGPRGFQGTSGVQGIQGPQGCRGFQGNDGIQGSTGITGAQGNDGVQGVQGTIGATGIQGMTGATGATGPKGFQGLQGPQGCRGFQGNDGVQGAGVQGSTGTTGLQGNSGNTGVQGFTGVVGAQGFTGSTGAAGTNGNSGVQGNSGTQGNSGFQGFTGAVGAQGSSGVQGKDGVQGYQGPIGPAFSTASITTTDATITTIATVPVNDNTVITLSVWTSARRTDSPDRGGFARNATIYREAGGAATMQNSVDTPYSKRSQNQWDASIDVSGNNAIITVKGKAGMTVNWFCQYFITNVT